MPGESTKVAVVSATWTEMVTQRAKWGAGTGGGS